MEHLSLPQGETLSSEDAVRCASTEYYDRGPFQEYAKRNPRLKAIDDFGDDIRPLPGIVNYFTKNSKLLEDLLQTWLFFGLLHEFFGDNVQDKDFVNLERKVIDTSKLVALTRQWYSTEQANSDTSRQRFADCLRHTYNILYVTLGTDFDENIRFSIASTAELLDRALQQAFPEKNTVGITWSLGFWSEARSSQMKQIGWCRYEAARLQTRRLSLCTLFFLSRIRKAATNHDHGKCAPDLCLFSERAKIDLEYVVGSSHRAPSCSCSEIGLAPEDRNRMVELLERNVVPLVQLDLDSDGTPQLCIVESSANTRYVAISHVFADGLGNRANNALRCCQLTYLHDVVALLDDKIEKSNNSKTLLWIDTLCCPLSPKDSKQKALTLMRQTYENADHVLILDAEMEKLSIDQIPILEQCARLLTSTWVFRLWTLQEGALAKHLWAQFADGAVNLSKVFMDMKHVYENFEVTRKAIFRDLLSSFQLIRENFADNSNSSLQRMAAAMENRLVSDPTDEALCMATLLNLDAGAIATVPPSERMRALWNILASQNGVPRSIVFHDGKKLQFPGYRWAPSTLLDLNTSLPVSVGWPRGVGIPISSGLLVHFPGALISACLPPDGLDVSRIRLPNPRMIWKAPGGEKFENLFVRDAYGGWFQMLSARSTTANASHSTNGDRTTSSSSSAGSLPYLHEMLQQDHKKYALILREDKILGGRKSYQGGESREGILVEIIAEEEHVSIVRKVRKVTLEFQESDMCTRLELAVAASQSIINSEEVRNYASALSSEPHTPSSEGISMNVNKTHRDSLMDLQKAISIALRNKPFAETPADTKKLAGMAFQALLGRYAVLQRWSEPTKAWAVD